MTKGLLFQVCGEDVEEIDVSVDMDTTLEILGEQVFGQSLLIFEYSLYKEMPPDGSGRRVIYCSMYYDAIRTETNSLLTEHLPNTPIRGPAVMLFFYLDDRGSRVVMDLPQDPLSRKRLQCEQLNSKGRFVSLQPK